jgi:hypothetical protein
MLATVTELAVTRQAILNSFGDDECEATDLINMDKLYAVENQIESATFKTRADKRAGSRILMEDKPSRCDNFQESLFLRMQQFA